ncbi:MAG: DEAD/DEAH box helicase [Acidimicrobiales bacterium]
MPTFADLGVRADIVHRLDQRGITAPFPIQAATLIDALAGRDVCGKAPTGSGKTLAFGIPLISRVGRARPKHPRGLVLVPTRELAAQVQKELVLIAGHGTTRIQTFYGGVGFGGQLAAVRKGTDIAVACPGRLADLVNRREIILSEVEFVVIDEADRMADMGFLPEVRRLLDQVRPDRQTLLFSATLDGDVDVLISRYQNSPARHELAVNDDAPANRHVFWRAERPERLKITSEVVTASWPSIVFCRTKRGADRVARQLNAGGVAAAPIHGDLSQGQRERALAAFTAGKVQALVATDIAARGIHVDDVASVVHYDLPADEKDYVHRSGRTGRAGAVGLVVAMVGADEMDAARKLQTKLRYPGGIKDADTRTLRGEGPGTAWRPTDVMDGPGINATKGGGARKAAASAAPPAGRRGPSPARNSGGRPSGPSVSRGASRSTGQPSRSTGQPSRGTGAQPTSQAPRRSGGGAPGRPGQASRRTGGPAGRPRRP